MGKTWSLQRTTQCQKCPWRKDVDPRTIPNGYSEEQHRDLACTIAKPADLSAVLTCVVHVMVCHETQSAHCLGWLMQQLGPGNNIALRLVMRGCTNIVDVRLLGAQHATFEDTLPTNPIYDAIKQADSAYTGERFLGAPDSWYEPPHWWCANGHRSTRYLKSEEFGGDVCLAAGCRLPVWLGPRDLPGITPTGE